MAPDEPTRPTAPADGGHPKLRRAGGLLIAVAIGLVAVVGLIVVFNARDDAGIEPPSGAGEVPGQAVDGAQLGPEQDRLLRLGNVIVVHGGAGRPPAALAALQERLSGPPDPALTAAGQAVLLERDPGVAGIEAHAFGRVLRVQDPADPQLDAFAAYWLGRGGDG